jgi:1,2-phenylacetyl-CoA epoxidase PaaB subunit
MQSIEQRNGASNMAKQIEVQVADYCELTIRRPGGEIEVVKSSKVKAMSPALLARMNKDMATAKRGQVISYKNITKTGYVTMTDADIADAGSERIANYKKQY